MPASKKTRASAGAIHSVVGSDEAEVKRRAAELAARLRPAEAGDFGSDIIDGWTDNADGAVTRIHETLQALLTVPFFGGEKLVWLKNVNFLADTPMGRAAGVLDALARLGSTLEAGLPDGVKFLLSALDADKRRSFYKSLGKLGAVEVFDKVDTSRSGWEDEVAPVIARQAGERGLQLRGDALELFTLLTGGDSRQVEIELEKLDLFLGPHRREATVKDVRTLVPQTRAGVIFELGNAVAQRDVRRSMELMEQLLRQGESAVGILLVAIVPTIRNLLLAKDLMSRHRLARPGAPWNFSNTLGRLPENALEHLPRKKDGSINAYPLGLAAMNAHRYGMAELCELLGACLNANVRLVTTPLDEKVVLSDLLARMGMKRSSSAT